MKIKTFKTEIQLIDDRVNSYLKELKSKKIKVLNILLSSSDRITTITVVHE